MWAMFNSTKRKSKPNAKFEIPSKGEGGMDTLFLTALLLRKNLFKALGLANYFIGSNQFQIIPTISK